MKKKRVEKWRFALWQSKTEAATLLHNLSKKYQSIPVVQYECDCVHRGVFFVLQKISFWCDIVLCLTGVCQYCGKKGGFPAFSGNRREKRSPPPFFLFFSPPFRGTYITQTYLTCVSKDHPLVHLIVDAGRAY